LLQDETLIAQVLTHEVMTMCHLLAL